MKKFSVSFPVEEIAPGKFWVNLDTIQLDPPPAEEEIPSIIGAAEVAVIKARATDVASRIRQRYEHPIRMVVNDMFMEFVNRRPR